MKPHIQQRTILSYAAGVISTFFPIILSAQINLPPELAQESITAGDTIHFSISPDVPPNCDTQIYIIFRASPGNAIALGGSIKKGEAKAAIDSQVAYDTPAGIYKSESGYLSPCAGYSANTSFKVPERNLVIKAYADPNRYTKNSDFQLIPTQKQLLDTKVDELKALDGRLTTALENQSADTRSLRDYLSVVVEEAQAALSTTEQQYLAQKKSDDPVPALFADFRLRYRHLLIDLRAPVPGNHFGASSQKLTHVQFAQRSKPLGEVTEATSFPPDVLAVREAISDNAAAYRYVARTGRFTFTARIRSVPDKALIKYRKQIETSYKDYSSPTEVPEAVFELATTIFKFHRDGCTDEPVRVIDPYNDPNPEISVEFSRCRKPR